MPWLHAPVCREKFWFLLTILIFHFLPQSQIQAESALNQKYPNLPTEAQSAVEMVSSLTVSFQFLLSNMDEFKSHHKQILQKGKKKQPSSRNKAFKRSRLRDDQDVGADREFKITTKEMLTDLEALKGHRTLTDGEFHQKKGTFVRKTETIKQSSGDARNKHEIRNEEFLQ